MWPVMLLQQGKCGLNGHNANLVCSCSKKVFYVATGQKTILDLTEMNGNQRRQMNMSNKKWFSQKPTS